MKQRYNGLAASICAAVMLLATCEVANAQTPNAYGYTTGYGTVYGSFGLASTMQSMYNVARAQSQKAESLNNRESNSAPGTSRTPAVAVSPRVARNRGAYRPDASIDTGKSIADILGETPEEKRLIREIYASTKTAYDKQATEKGWTNNMGGGLTFFTVAAMSVYRDGEAPSDQGVETHYRVLNAALDELPGVSVLTNKDKQNFDNTMICFGGILLAGYVEGKQTNNAHVLADYKKLAGMLIEMVLKTDPDNLRLENGMIVMK